MAVKTGYPLTRIKLPYYGLRCQLIEVKCFLWISADQLLVLICSQVQDYVFQLVLKSDMVLA